MPRSRLFIWLLKKGFPLRIFFSKFTRVPLLGKVMDHMMFAGDDILYLPKDETARIIEINKPLEKLGETVVPSIIVEHFVEEAEYHFIMDWCICRSSSKCDHYPIELGCLFLGEASTKIDKNLGRIVTKEEALKHVKKCREAGLVHLIGRNKLDTVWLKVGPGEKLLTICNCCDCCCLWRILPHVSNKIASKVNKMPGVSVSVNDDCIGCGTCVDVCFVQSIKIVDNKSVISEACRGCGRCVLVCPENAISLTIDDTQNIEESIKRIESLVDLT
jgi:ferredoxin